MVQAQFGATGVNFQGALFDQSGGGYLINTSLTLRATIYEEGNSTNILWQEEHTATSGVRGVFVVVIGQGTSTGAGSAVDFVSIDFQSTSTALSIEVAVDNGPLVPYHDGPFQAVPYAYHSQSSNQAQALNDLTDVDTTAVSSGDVLTWDGTNWVVGVSSIEYHADTAGYSQQVDTVNFAYVTLPSTNQDTVLYAAWSDTATYADTVLSIPHFTNVIYADTAGFAYAINGWRQSGNVLGSGAILGATNNKKLLFSTNATDRFELASDGKFLWGAASAVSDLRIDHNQGFQYKKISATGAGTYFDASGSNPVVYHSGSNSSFYGGGMSDTLWDPANQGEQTFVYGFNNAAMTSQAMAVGDSNVVDNIPANGTTSTGLQAMAIGRGNFASGAFSLAAGYQSSAIRDRSVAMGYQCSTLNSYASVAMGYKATTNGLNMEPTFAIGNYVSARGWLAVAMGHAVNFTNVGGFVYGDYSTNDTLIASVSYRFYSRSSGGVDFYSSTNLSTGVHLPAGAGAWSTVSDSTTKENIRVENAERFWTTLRDLELFEWTYLSQPGVMHIGPMAQSFYNAFGYGESNLMITSTDMDGVTLYGITLLLAKYDALQQDVDAVQAENENTENLEYQSLDDRLQLLEQQMEALRKP